MRETLLRRRNGAVASPSPNLILTISPIEGFFLGAVSRALAELLIYPYTRAKMVIVGRTKHDAAKGTTIQRAKSTGALLTVMRPIRIIYELFMTEGFCSLYQGILPQITRGVLSTAIMLATKESLFVYIRSLLGRVQALAICK